MRMNIGVAVAAAVAVLLAAGVSSAHHSFAGGGFDRDKAVTVRGVIVSIDWVNPHSWIFVDATDENGRMDRWALEGPSLLQLTRRNVDRTRFKAGDRIQACGYGTRDGVETPVPGAVHPSNARRMSAELLTLATGEELVWSNYGQRKCLD